MKVKNFNPNYISRFLTPPKHYNNIISEIGYIQERNQKLNIIQNPNLKSVDLSNMNTNYIKIFVSKSVNLHNFQSSTMKIGNNENKIKQMIQHKKFQSRNIEERNYSCLKREIQFYQRIKKFKTKSKDYDSYIHYSSPRATSSKSNEIIKNNNKYKPVSKSVLIKNINRVINKISVRSRSKIENLAVFQKRTSSSNKLNFSINDKKTNTSKNNLIENELNCKKFNSHNEKTAKINKIYSNAEESNLIESHFNAKTMTNKEIINLNWAPQNSILLRNKYKNLIEKS